MLATTAIEAATHAGAEFADIRVSELRTFEIPLRLDGSLVMTLGYGIRVRVQGREAFVGAVDATRDGVVHAAQRAVAAARDHAKTAAPARPMVATPVVKGEWTSPTKIDPFAISPDDHVVILNGITTWHRRLNVDVWGILTWESETRVFASSEGSLMTQRATRVEQMVEVEGGTWRSYPGDRFLVPGIVSQTAGVEAVLGDRMHARFEEAVEDMSQIIKAPRGHAEVGRKDVVLDGANFGAVLARTVIPALFLGRALGEEQDGEGTSFLAPPSDIVSKELFSPLLNVWVEADAPAYGAMRWDDEGIATHSVPLIEQGKVQRYLGTRANADAMTTIPVDGTTVLDSTASPSAVRGATLGVAYARNVLTLPSARPGAVSVRPPATGPSLTELAETLHNGYLVRNGSLVVDQQGAGGAILPRVLLEVQRGKITRRILKTRLEFSTQKLLRNILALGGPKTVAAANNQVSGGLPWNSTMCVAQAPAVVLKDLNIMTN